MNKFINISELSKILDLVHPISKKPLNHILRYWEKEFKQIKPKKINNRRYYSIEQVENIKLIKFLLKDKGMTILGVKNVLNLDINKLDGYNSDSLQTAYYKNKLKFKSKLLLEKIKKLKQYGKKNSSKSKNGSRK
jgi:DNA-binding transcriptional MerR regulator